MFRKRPVAPSVPPEWLIVGLGNPGPEYANTRHNVGFMAVDLVAERQGVKLTQSKHRSRYVDTVIDGASVRLVRPLTYMNASGQAIAPHLKELGLKPDRLLVITDDTDLPPGKIRVRAGGSAGGHNGHRSIIASLGLDAYPRVKIGIGRVPKEATVEHVLGKITGPDREPILEAVQRAADAAETIVKEGLIPAMDRFNPKA